VTTTSHDQDLADIERARRMRALREALDTVEHPSHPDVVALADQIINLDRSRPRNRSGR
jgi:hypothetical protein